MDKRFFLNEQDLWVFRIPRKPQIKEEDVYLDTFSKDATMSFVMEAFRNDWEIRFLPNALTPLIFIVTPDQFYHFFNNARAAHAFKDDVMNGDFQKVVSCHTSH